MIRNLGAYARAASDDGKMWASFFQKTSLPAPVANIWTDLSMGAGTPKYNAYVGGQLEATPFIGSGNNGIYAGPQPDSSSEKYLNNITAHTSAATGPFNLLLADYLMFYPLCDGDSTDLQIMDNTQTLPRYQDGEGVQCFAVVTTPMTANTNITMEYIDSNGNTKTTVFSLIFSSVTGTVVSTNGTSQSNNSRSLFVNLAEGGSGIRSITSIQLSTGAGGFFCLVLCKPLATLVFGDNNCPAEISYINQNTQAKRIYDGAYLNFLCHHSSTTSLVPIQGYLEFVTVN